MGRISPLMAGPSIAQALLDAHQRKASGWITVKTLGQDSKLTLKDGDLVGAQMGFGHQSVLQGLLQSRRINLSQLDALWARGEAGSADEETLEELGTSGEDARAQQALANVRRLTELGESVQFEEGQVDGESLLSGVQLVRAAYEAIFADADDAPVFRCLDVPGSQDWVMSPDEREFIESFAEFRSAQGLARDRRVLLELLTQVGTFESIPAAEWKQREEGRVAEEKRQEDELARLREEARLAEEARIAE
ncbi:MAG: DnaJ protein, partial [Myxococcaceae bacterium]|nr:DnaJ protein [Myxococcaceae bacterium]